MRAALVTLVITAAAAGFTSTAHAGFAIAHPRDSMRPEERGIDSTAARRLELGWTIGTPAGANLNVGWWFDRDWGTHVSGMYWGHFHGVQGNVSRTFSRSRTVRWAFTGLAGGYASDSDDLHYGGAGVDGYLGGFYLEAAIVAFGGRGHPSGNAGIVGQIGFVGGGGVRGPR